MPVLRSHRRAVVGGAVAVVIVVALAIGLLEGGDEVTPPDAVPTLAEARAAVSGAPPALARLYAGAGGSRVLDVDEQGFRAVLRRLRGRPVVLNSWYPACGPCREEFPILRRAAADYGTRVAFVGLIKQGSDAAVASFLRAQPTVYPHVRDPGASIARSLDAGQSFPSTIVLDSHGRVATVYPGAYPSLTRLAQDLERYAGVGPRRASAGVPGAAGTTTGAAR